MKDWLLYAYMNTNAEEIRLLDTVAQLYEERQNSPSDDYLLSRLSIFIIESDLGYRDNPDKFKKLYASLKKRNLLEVVYRNGSYLKTTEKSKDFLVEFEEFSRLPGWAQFSKLVSCYLPGILSVLSLLISIIALIFFRFVKSDSFAISA